MKAHVSSTGCETRVAVEGELDKVELEELAAKVLSG